MRKLLLPFLLVLGTFVGFAAPAHAAVTQMGATDWLNTSCRSAVQTQLNQIDPPVAAELSAIPGGFSSATAVALDRVVRNAGYVPLTNPCRVEVLTLDISTRTFGATVQFTVTPTIGLPGQLTLMFNGATRTVDIAGTGVSIDLPAPPRHAFDADYPAAAYFIPTDTRIRLASVSTTFHVPARPIPTTTPIQVAPVSKTAVKISGPTRATKNKKVTLTARVASPRAGRIAGKVEWLVNGKRVAVRKLNASGKTKISHRPRKKGTLTVRATFRPANPKHYRSSNTKRTIKVR